MAKKTKEEFEEYKNYFSADFETTSNEQYKIDGYTRVWSYGVCNLFEPENSYKCGTNIDDFLKTIMSSHKNYFGDYRKRICFFHNLKFDGEFIVYRLIEMGYEHFIGDSREMPVKHYSMLKDDRGILYSISVQVDSKRQVVFQDSLKLINFRVGKIAKDFKITVDGKEIVKGEIDYDKYREIDYQLDDNEKSYQFRDVIIVAKALRELFKLAGICKPTIASMAMEFYKKKSFSKYLDFCSVFPSPDFDTWEFIKNAYAGGWCYCNELNAGKEYDATYTGKKYFGFGIDVNSMYPAVLYNKPLPYGEPNYFEGIPPKDKLYVVSVKISAYIKDGALPYVRCNQIDGGVGNNYTKEINGLMYLTNIDLEMINKCYDIEDIEYIDGYWFDSTIGLFKDYVDYWMEVKKNNTGALRAIAKLFLNSLYGKFGAGYEHIGKISIMDEETGSLKDITTPIEYDDTLSYIPVACFVTSYARAQIVTDSMKLGQINHLYTDTDSIKFYYPCNTLEDAENYCISKGIEIHQKNLGAYKIENLFLTGKFLRAKTYTYQDGFEGDPNEYHITACGAPKDSKQELIDLIIKDGYDAFAFGVVVGGKLKPKRVKGGIVLEPITFKMQEKGLIGF